MRLTDKQVSKMSEYGIPDYMQGGLIRYYENRIEPGHFLSAVLRNDLMGAFGRADENNRAALWSYVLWLYNQAPSGSYGSVEAFKGWLTGTSECYRRLHPEEAA